MLPVGDWVLKKLDKENKIDLSKKRKNFAVSFWKTVFYCSVLLYACYALKGENWVYSWKGLAGTWGMSKTPTKILFYYHVEFAYYLVEIFYLFQEHNYNDFWQMFTHHLVACALLVISYCKDILRPGMAIIVLHDISDPFLEICKIAAYVSNQLIANITFICFMVVFIGARLAVYPFLIVMPTTIVILQHNFDIVLYGLVLMMYALIIMHIVWSCIIIIKIAARVMTGKGAKDIRSTDEEKILNSNQTT